MLNRYSKKSKTREAKFREIIKLFSLDFEASKIAEMSGVSRCSLNDIFKKIRTRIAEYCEYQSSFEKGEVEMDDFFLAHAEFVRNKAGERTASTLFLA